MEREVINRLSESLKEIRNDFDISTFVIIQRDDDGLWDILVAGSDLEDSKENLVKVAKIISKSLEPKDLNVFSRVVLLNTKDAFISALRKLFSVKNGDMELRNTQINNILVSHAYLLYSL